MVSFPPVSPPKPYTPPSPHPYTPHAQHISFLHCRTKTGFKPKTILAMCTAFKQLFSFITRHIYIYIYIYILKRTGRNKNITANFMHFLQLILLYELQVSLNFFSLLRDTAFSTCHKLTKFSIGILKKAPWCEHNKSEWTIIIIIIIII